MKNLSGKSVLVADQHQLVRSLVRQAVSSLGSRSLFEAGDGTGLLQLIMRTAPDVAVIDVRLPGLDGLEVARRLRRVPDDRVRRTGIVMLMAGATPELVREARNAGVDEVLCKPFSAEGLQQRLLAAAFNRREFITVDSYVGPCRRRFVDPLFQGVERRDNDDLLHVPTKIVAGLAPRMR